MQRTYRSIEDNIFKLQSLVELLVCQVWCNASDTDTCESLLTEGFAGAYNAYPWLKKEVDDVYDKCKTLTTQQRADIREAFYVNNRIEDLCNGVIKPIELSQLPSVVSTNMKPLLSKFYKPLLDQAEIPGNKLDYYNNLIRSNKYNTCPCCGLVEVESAHTHYVEDNDHFFPQAHYPFAVVNFKNLVPLCDKCNKKHKTSKKPLDYNGVAYYPFENRASLDVHIAIDEVKFDSDQQLSSNLDISFSGDGKRNSTWNWLYNIEDRYTTEVKRFSFSWLRRLKAEIEFNSSKTIEEVIDFNIASFEKDKFDEVKFLKIAFLEDIKAKPEWMAVYHELGR